MDTAWAQVAPTNPEAQVQVLGAVHLPPLSHAASQTGWLQNVPAYPGWHLHVACFATTTHLPPLRQVPPQSGISQAAPVYGTWQLQRFLPIQIPPFWHGVEQGEGAWLSVGIP
jgi:hypothetical protein